MAIIPIAQRWNHDADEMEFILSNDDWEKCRQGYGCSNCLCDYNGLYLAKCPDCGATTFSAFEPKRDDMSFQITRQN
jgi:hypothetical protein